MNLQEIVLDVRHDWSCAQLDQVHVAGCGLKTVVVKTSLPPISDMLQSRRALRFGNIFILDICTIMMMHTCTPSFETFRGGPHIHASMFHGRICD